MSTPADENAAHLAAPCPVYDHHCCDNQGCCHGCGVMMAEDWWHAYAGDDADPPYKIGPVMAITGHQVQKLMRKHKVTIRQLKDSSGLLMKRIREVRSSGLQDRGAARDWIQAITGTDPGLEFEKVIR